MLCIHRRVSQDELSRVQGCQISTQPPSNTKPICWPPPRDSMQIINSLMTGEYLGKVEGEELLLFPIIIIAIWHTYHRQLGSILCSNLWCWTQHKSVSPSTTCELQQMNDNLGLEAFKRALEMGIGPHTLNTQKQPCDIAVSHETLWSSCSAKSSCSPTDTQRLEDCLCTKLFLCSIYWLKAPPKGIWDNFPTPQQQMLRQTFLQLGSKDDNSHQRGEEDHQDFDLQELISLSFSSFTQLTTWNTLARLSLENYLL